MEEETTAATFNRIDYDIPDLFGKQSAEEYLTEGLNGPSSAFGGVRKVSEPNFGQREDIDLADKNSSSVSSGDSDLNGEVVGEKEKVLEKTGVSDVREEIQSHYANENLDAMRNVFDDKENRSVDVPDANKTSYTIHGFDGGSHDEDEGFIKLRSILDTAERSIIDFQNDIHVGNVYPFHSEVNLNNRKVHSWLRPNGGFATGFWESWSSKHDEREFKQVPLPYSGTPRKSVWTPEIIHESREKFVHKGIRHKKPWKKYNSKRSRRHRSLRSRKSMN